MRRIVNVCGVNRRTGKSKATGKPYDFTELHFTYADDYVAGLKAANAIVNQSMIGQREIMVGEDLDLVFHVFQNKVIVDAVL